MSVKKTYGYIRVSSLDQNEDRQIQAMKAAGIADDCVFIDKQSGKDFKRPQYRRMIRKLKEGDTIFIKSIDRLGRNYEEILEQWRLITKEKKTDIVVLDMPLLDTRQAKDLLGTFIAYLVLGIFSYVSENERFMIRERQAEGIAAARVRGVHLGRKPSPLPDNFEEVYLRWKSKEITLAKAGEECGMPPSTFFYRAGKYRV